MDGYVQVSLKDMLESVGEDRVKAILSTFSCPLNRDVERYLTGRTAIEFAKQGVSPTQLVFTSYKGSMVLIGYYTLALKDFVIKDNAHIGSTLRKKLNKFSIRETELKIRRIPAPLIAQLGKNFTNGYNKLITGDELLKLAIDKISMVQSTVGGKIIYVECEDKPELLEFYFSNGFVEFDKRALDRDEEIDFEGKYLIQMLKYMK